MKQIRGVALVLLAATTCAAAAADSGSVTLTRVTTGEIGGWMRLTVSVAGLPGQWVLDTGSNRNLVSPAFAQRLGLAAGPRVATTAGAGRVVGNEVVLPMLQLGGLERAAQRAMAAELGPIVGAAAQGADGVLGTPFLEDLEVDIDLRSWQISMRASSGAACPADSAEVALTRQLGLAVIKVSVNGGAEEAVLLDTGNPAGLVRPVSRAPAPSEPGIVVDSSRLLIARQVAIGPLLRRDVPVVFYTAPALRQALGSEITGLAGTALFDGTWLRLDLSRQRACLQAASLAVPGGFGLMLAWRGDTLRVDRILPGGPAEAAGLKPGDTITAWAGGAPGGDLPQLWARAQGRDEIEVQAGGRDFRLRRALFAPLLPPGGTAR